MSTVIEVRVGSLVTGLAAALCSELTTANEEADIPKPTLCTVLPGSAVAFDYCDTGGMAYARLAGIVPIITQTGNTCVTEYEITVEIGVLRCAPMIDEDGTLPSDAEQLAASMQQFFDMGLMHKVLTCTPVGDPLEFAALGSYVPVGPDGGCVGGTWTGVWRTS